MGGESRSELDFNYRVLALPRMESCLLRGERAELRLWRSWVRHDMQECGKGACAVYPEGVPPYSPGFGEPRDRVGKPQLDPERVPSISRTQWLRLDAALTGL